MKETQLYVWSGRTDNYLCKLATRAENKEEAIELLSKEMVPNEYGWGVLEVDSNPICICDIQGRALKNK